MICSPKVSSARQLATMNKHGVDVFFTKTQRLPGLLNPSPEEQRATGVAAGLLPTVADASVHAVDRMASIQILKCDGDSDNRPQFGRVSAGEVRCSDCDARPGSTAFSVPLLLRGGEGSTSFCRFHCICRFRCRCTRSGPGPGPPRKIKCVSRKENSVLQSIGRTKHRVLELDGDREPRRRCAMVPHAWYPPDPSHHPAAAR